MPTTAESQKLPDGKQGDTYGPYSVRLGRRAVAGGPSVPVDVTGWAARCQARTLPAGEPGSRLVATLCDGPPDAAGRWYLTAAAAAMLLVLEGRYYWDFQVTRLDGSVRTLMAGLWTVTGDVTR